MSRIVNLPRRLFLLTVMAVTLAASGAPAQDRQQAAEAFMQGLGDSVVSILRSDPTYDEALPRFRDLFVSGFDIPTVGRFVLGRYWNVADEQQQQSFVDLFEELIVRTYTRRFMDYSGETFAVTGSRPDGDSDYIVQSRINRGGGAPPVAVDWRVRDYGDRIQILDVVIEGISQGATQRQEFASIIQRNGGSVDALLQRMREAVSG